jgi:formiminoglutamate deiminase
LTSTAYHCEFAWLGDDRAAADVLVVVEGDRIISVRAEAGAPMGAVRLAGLTIPGLANTHSHAFHRMLRGRAQLGAGSFWSWRDKMYALADRLEPESYFALARATFAEMAMAGIVCVGEFHYLHHRRGGDRYSRSNEMGVVLIAAAREAGIRITLLDACYLSGGIAVPLNEVQRRFSDGSAGAWAARVNELLPLRSQEVHIGAAIHSVRAVAPDPVAEVARFARANNLPLHAHISEQQLENEQCFDRFGLTPVGVMAQQGALSKNFTAVHATHVSADDIRLLAVNGCGVCFCPTTERDLADGVGPSTALKEAGVALSLGSDSHAVIDMFEEMRALEMDERLFSGVRGNSSAAQLLMAAGEVGHRSLGWDQAGRIAPGQLADLVSVHTHTVRAAGSSAGDVLEAVAFSAVAGDVHNVVVSGRTIVRNGVHLYMNVPDELARAMESIW